MGSWTDFLLAYLLGGLTFIPLVLITVLVHAHLTFPVRDDLGHSSVETAEDIVQPGDDVDAIQAIRLVHKEESKTRTSQHEADVAAGYFAVCREYTPMGINAKPIERSTPVGPTTVAAPSPSVYQAMYRSIFDRKQPPGPLDNNNNNNNNNTTSQRPKKAGNVFYVVLRHGHLMLFDDDEQLEVRYVISLAHHDVSIYSGGDKTPEGELFIKRNALCLSRKSQGIELAPDTQITKPFYLFSENCSAKEDFYFALLRNQSQALYDDSSPSPMQFEVKNIISLVQKLHSSEEHLQTRWLNAMIGRIFLAVYQTHDLESFIREKLTKKISRVKRPSFLSGISIQKIDTGDAAPYVTNPRLKDLTVEGECGVECDVKYTGNFRLEVTATARLDLGSRFKARDINLVLAVVVRRVEGHVLFKIKPPPSNRIWFSFQQMPKMEMTIEPIVSSRQITYTVILRQIENRIKEVIAESVVLPFWDDVPFFRTEHKKWRGGIFVGDDNVETSPDFENAVAQLGDVDEVDRLEDGESVGLPGIEKSHSLPAIETSPLTGLFGRRPNGKGFSTPKSNASTTSVDIRPDSLLHHDAPLSRPSSSPPDPASSPIATAPFSGKQSPANTPAGSPLKASGLSKSSSISSSSSRDATDTEKDTDVTPKRNRGQNSQAPEEAEQGDEPSSNAPSLSGKSSIKSQTGSLARGFFLRRENSTSSSAPSAGSHPDQAKRNTLAAVTNAAVSAKRWGLNAIQRHGDGNNHNNAPAVAAPHLDVNQPMGRGRPLPPPGVPLPMPDRKTKTTQLPALKRKPVAPPPQLERSKPSDDHEQTSSRRPVPPPPLPKRRLGSRDESVAGAGAGDGSENMLVVAAPEDSAPTTPLEEEIPGYAHPWLDDAEGNKVQAGEGKHSDGEGSLSASDTGLVDEKSLSDEPTQGEEQRKGEESRDDERDDISAWLDSSDSVESPAADIPSAEVAAH